MIDVSIHGDRVVFEVEGWSEKLLSLRSGLEVPLAHVKTARVDDDAAKGWWHGVKIAGSDLPGVITAGSFYRKGRFIFYDTHKPEQTIVVELEGEQYDTLVLQVRDPAGAVETILEALKHV